jgi:hypothetical protein
MDKFNPLSFNKNQFFKSFCERFSYQWLIGVLAQSDHADGVQGNGLSNHRVLDGHDVWGRGHSGCVAEVGNFVVRLDQRLEVRLGDDAAEFKRLLAWVATPRQVVDQPRAVGENWFRRLDRRLELVLCLQHAPGKCRLASALENRARRVVSAKVMGMDALRSPSAL